MALEDSTSVSLQAQKLDNLQAADLKSENESKSDKASKGAAAIYSHLGNFVDTTLFAHHDDLGAINGIDSAEDDSDSDTSEGVLGGTDSSDSDSGSNSSDSKDDTMKKYPANASLALLLAGQTNEKNTNKLLESLADLTSQMTTIATDVMNGERTYEQNFYKHGVIDSSGQASINMGYQELTGTLSSKNIGTKTNPCMVWVLNITVDGVKHSYQISRGGRKLNPPTDPKDVPSYLKKYGLAYPDDDYPGDADDDKKTQFENAMKGKPTAFKVIWTDGPKVAAGGGIDSAKDSKTRDALIKMMGYVQQKGSTITTKQQTLSSTSSTESNVLTQSVSNAQSGQQQTLQAVFAVSNLVSGWRNVS